MTIPTTSTPTTERELFNPLLPKGRVGIHERNPRLLKYWREFGHSIIMQINKRQSASLILQLSNSEKTLWIHRLKWNRENLNELLKKQKLDGILMN